MQQFWADNLLVETNPKYAYPQNILKNFFFLSIEFKNFRIKKCENFLKSFQNNIKNFLILNKTIVFFVFTQNIAHGKKKIKF